MLRFNNWQSKFETGGHNYVLSSYSIEGRSLFSYRVRLTSFEFSNCRTEERGEAIFENEMASYRALQLNKAQLPMFSLFSNIAACRMTS